jgi:hypothetical protein
MGVGGPVSRPGTPAGATNGAERHGEGKNNPREVTMSSTEVRTEGSTEPGTVEGVTTAAPGSARDLMLVVHDIGEARDELISRGVEVSEIYHYGSRPFHSAGTDARVPGPDPDGRSYFTWASFSDPDGNGWLLQEIKTRLPGREWT